MNGYLENLPLSFALPANRPTGKPMPTPESEKLLKIRWIYGLFDSSKVCYYIGQTWDLRERKRAWEVRLRKLQIQPLDFCLLRHCPEETAHIIEAQVIKAYKRKGQATLNKSVRPFRATRLANTGNNYFCERVNRWFSTLNEIAVFTGSSRSTVNNHLKGVTSNSLGVYEADKLPLNLREWVDWSI